MKFAVVMALVAEEIEDSVRDAAAAAGAGGVTVITGRGSGAEEKKSFLGLTYEGTQSILFYILEKHICLKVLKAIKRTIAESKSGDGVAFSLPIEHVTGLDVKQVERFEKQILNDI